MSIRKKYVSEMRKAFDTYRTELIDRDGPYCVECDVPVADWDDDLDQWVIFQHCSVRHQETDSETPIDALECVCESCNLNSTYYGPMVEWGEQAILEGRLATHAYSRVNLHQIRSQILQERDANHGNW